MYPNSLYENHLADYHCLESIKVSCMRKLLSSRLTSPPNNLTVFCYKIIWSTYQDVLGCSTWLIELLPKLHNRHQKSFVCLSRVPIHVQTYLIILKTLFYNAKIRSLSQQWSYPLRLGTYDYLQWHKNSSNWQKLLFGMNPIKFKLRHSNRRNSRFWKFEVKKVKKLWLLFCGNMWDFKLFSTELTKL